MAYRKQPDHPDFWILAAIVQDMDMVIKEAESEAEKNRRWHNIVDPLFHPDSVAYVGMQRAMRILGIDTPAQLATRQQVLTRMTAAHTEAVAVGVMLERRRVKQYEEDSAAGLIAQCAHATEMARLREAGQPTNRVEWEEGKKDG